MKEQLEKQKPYQVLEDVFKEGLATTQKAFGEMWIENKKEHYKEKGKSK